MPKALSEDKYQALLQYYIDHGTNHREAAKAAGVTYPTAKKYFEKGVGDFRAIAIELQELQSGARTRRYRTHGSRSEIEAALMARDLEMATAQADSAKDAAKTIAEEAELISESRKHLRFIDSAVIAPVVATGSKLAEKLYEWMQRDDVVIGDGENGTLAPGDVINAIKSINGLVRVAAASKREVIEAERARLGDPMQWVSESQEMLDIPTERVAALESLRAARDELAELEAALDGGADVVDE